MKILVIESSSEKGCIALGEEGKILAQKKIAGGPSLSKSLPLEVKNLLGAIKPDLVGVGVGPGSYTGIRVGAALAQGLSYGWGVPLFGFCSLQSFGVRPVLIDARMGGLYALFGDEAERVNWEDERLQKNSWAGSPHPELIRKKAPQGIAVEEIEPDPEQMIELVYTQFLQGKTTPLTLSYLSCP